MWLNEAVNTHSTTLAPFCISADSMPQVLQNDAKAAKADFTPALLEGLQQYPALTTSFTGWVSHTHRSASPLLLNEARGVFLPTLKSLKDSQRLRPQGQSLRALYSLYRFVHAANTPFFSTKVVFPRKWGQLQSSEQLSADTVDLACPLATCAAGNESILLLLCLLINTGRSESTKSSMKQRNTNVAGKSYETSHGVRECEQVQNGKGVDLLPKKTTLGEVSTIVR